MAKFTDTPKWKTRAGYLRALEQTTTGKAPKPMRVACPTCGAARRLPCKEPDGSMRTLPHAERREEANRATRAQVLGAANQAGRSRARWAGVEVRFECPICGGNHPRADCREAA